MLEKLKIYANFLIKKCLSMNENEPLLVSYYDDQKYFVDIIKEECKKLNINEIYEIETSVEKTNELLRNLNIDEIKSNPYFDRSLIKEVYDKKGSILYLDSYHENNSNDIDSKKIKAMNEVKLLTQKDARYKREIYDFPWCIAGCSTKAWSEKIFGYSDIEKLWNLIFDCTYINTNDPIKSWEDLIKDTKEKCRLLNDLKIKKLNYKNSLGTDLDVYLINNSTWYGVGEESFDKKKKLLVNIPSFEVFTSPDTFKTEGVVYSSKPLIYNGKEINDIKLIFKNGKVVDAKASKNEDELKRMIEEFDNMDMLGECALVDYDSAVSNTNVLFNSTLFDENASCHLALGDGFSNTIEGGNKLSKEELYSLGINNSKNHVDFMIGTKDLNIVATDYYDNEVLIYKDGNFNKKEVINYIKERNK